jgi:hypothetical protein
MSLNNQINAAPSFMVKVIAPSITFALLWVLVMSSLYFSLLVWLMGGTRMALIQLATYGPWMAVLGAGFLVQLILFFYERRYARFYATVCDSHGKQVGVSGAATGTAMLACCMHHIFEILPFLGLATVGAIFGRFQFLFIEIGIATNLLGIVFMMSNIQKHQLYQPNAEAIFTFIQYKTLFGWLAYASVGYLIFSILRILS